jgi:hypothetical protein
MGTYRIKEAATGKIVVSDFYSAGPAKAEAECPKPRANYVLELVSTDAPARESGSLQTVELREQANMGTEDMEVYRDLLRISQSFNPDKPDEFHAEFLRGRDSSGEPLEDLGRALGLQGRGLQHFMKGRD